MSKSLKVIFAGTPDFAASSLAAVLNSHHQVVAVYTQPDRKSGRGKKVTMSPVKELALQHHIPVEQPLNFKSEESLSQLASYQADIMVVVAYGLLLPQKVLDIPKLGCINVHGSLLPRWRGAAPIQRAIQAGDKETGITIMQMEAGLDTGPMLLTASTPISDRDSGATLHDRLADMGAQLLVQALDEIADNKLQATPQDDQLATYAHKLSKEEAQINWQLSAEELERTIRAFNSWPVAYSQLDNKTVRIWQAKIVHKTVDAAPGTILQADADGILISCGEDCLLLTELQLPGSRAMSAKHLLNAPKNQQLFAPDNQFVSL